MLEGQLDFYETIIVPAYGRGRPPTVSGQIKKQKAAAAKARRAANSAVSADAKAEDYRRKRKNWDAKRYDRDPEKVKAGARRSYRKHYAARAATAKEQYRRKLAIGMLYRAEKRATGKGWDFNLTIDDVVIPMHCPVLGIPLNVGAGEGRVAGCTDDSPTLDRTDNSKGYIKGNVCVISWRANRIKGDASLAEMEKLLEYMRGFA